MSDDESYPVPSTSPTSTVKVIPVTGKTISFETLEKPAPVATIQESPPSARQYVAGRKQ